MLILVIGSVSLDVAQLIALLYLATIKLRLARANAKISNHMLKYNRHIESVLIDVGYLQHFIMLTI